MAKGHPNFKNEIGNRYGKLVVIEKAQNDKTTNQASWICKCDCGNTSIVRGTTLRSGNTSSCGCNVKLPKGTAAFNAFYQRRKYEARRRDIYFELSFDQVREITSKDCNYCGCPPLQIWRSNSWNGEYIYNGIDRINNEIGYTYENCVPCCWICNRSKGGLPVNEFRYWINKVHSHWASKPEF